MKKSNYEIALWFGNVNKWLGPVSMIVVLCWFFAGMIQDRPLTVLLDGISFVFVSVTYANAMYELRKIKERK